MHAQGPCTRPKDAHAKVMRASKRCARASAKLHVHAQKDARVKDMGMSSKFCASKKMCASKTCAHPKNCMRQGHMRGQKMCAPGQRARRGDARAREMQVQRSRTRMGMCAPSRRF